MRLKGAILAAVILLITLAACSRMRTGAGRNIPGSSRNRRFEWHNR